MPFAHRNTFIPGRCQVGGDGTLLIWQRHVQILRTRIVRVTAREDAAPAWTAAGNCQKGLIQTHAFLGQLIQIRGSDGRVAIASEISLAMIICDEDEDIGWLGRRLGTHQGCANDRQQAQQVSKNLVSHRVGMEHLDIKPCPVPSCNG